MRIDFIRIRPKHKNVVWFHNTMQNMYWKHPCFFNNLWEIVLENLFKNVFYYLYNIFYEKYELPWFTQTSYSIWPCCFQNQRPFFVEELDTENQAWWSTRSTGLGVLFYFSVEKATGTGILNVNLSSLWFQKKYLTTNQGKNISYCLCLCVWWEWVGFCKVSGPCNRITIYLISVISLVWKKHLICCLTGYNIWNLN